jgi:hypothetical protein
VQRDALHRRAVEDESEAALVLGREGGAEAGARRRERDLELERLADVAAGGAHLRPELARPELARERARRGAHEPPRDARELAHGRVVERAHDPLRLGAARVAGRHAPRRRRAGQRGDDDGRIAVAREPGTPCRPPAPRGKRASRAGGPGSSVRLIACSMLE